MYLRPSRPIAHAAPAYRQFSKVQQLPHPADGSHAAQPATGALTPRGSAEKSLDVCPAISLAARKLAALIAPAVKPASHVYGRKPRRARAALTSASASFPAHAGAAKNTRNRIVSAVRIFITPLGWIHRTVYQPAKAASAPLDRFHLHHVPAMTAQHSHVAALRTRLVFGFGIEHHAAFAQTTAVDVAPAFARLRPSTCADARYGRMHFAEILSVNNHANHPLSVR